MTVCTDRDYVALVRSFPVLGGRSGLAPAPGVTTLGIDLETLEAWGNGEEVSTLERPAFPGTGAVDAVRFVLAVFSTRHPWKVGPFDLFRALQTWDGDQRRAFAAWLNNPVRP